MTDQTGQLTLIRHHESEWNKLSRWTGMSDVSLTPHGRTMAEKMGQAIKDRSVDKVITSELARSIETAEGVLKGMELSGLSIERVEAINERDYGDYTGKNKWRMKEVLGEEKFTDIRRGWDCPVPGGETLKMVYERVVPYYLNNIVPELMNGQNILLVGHTNSLRALIKYIENISDQEIRNVEMPFGTIIIYDVDEIGRQIAKEVKTVE